MTNKLSQADQIRNEIRRLVNGLTVATQQAHTKFPYNPADLDRLIASQFETACRIEALVFGGPNNPPIKFEGES